MILGLIGYGSIARQTLGVLAERLDRPLNAAVCLAKSGGAGRAQALLDSFGPALAERRLAVDSLAAFLEAAPDFAAEAAGHAALAAHGAAILASGRGLIVTSAGALADDGLRAALDNAAAGGGARYCLCAGAIGGLDILAAARLAGLSEVIYTSRKPPAAWRGTPAESRINLNAMAEALCFFEGSARDAARDYPQNANVAATLALQGLGFERTRVKLIADPAAARNTHEILIRSACADITLAISGAPSPDNPKTSMTTGYALAAHILEEIKSRA